MVSMEASGDASARDLDEARSAARTLRIQVESLVQAAKIHPRGRDKRLLKQAEDGAQSLEENAATILVAQAAWNADHPETDDQLREALAKAEGLARSVES